VPLYATYDTTTASRLIRWRGRGRYFVAAVFDPPVGFTGARPVALRKHGGKRHNPRDLNAGGNPTLQELTDVLGAFVILYDVDPGGFWRGDGEEVDLELADESLASDALFVMLVRAHCADSWLVGTTRTIDPRVSAFLLLGESSGAYDSIRCQLVPLGGFDDLAQSAGIRGGGPYRFDPDHRVGFLFLFIGQNWLHDFNAYETRKLLASTATGSSSGASTLAVSSGTPPMRAGCAIGYDLSNGDGVLDPRAVTYYLLASDYAGGAGNVAITTTLADNVPNGTPLWFGPAETTYTAATSGGSNAAGASVLRLVGDAVELKRANRLRVRASSGATSTGSSSGSNTLAVSSGFPALRTGTYVYYDLGGGPVEHNVVADYAGGAGALSIFPVLPADVPNGTALSVRFDCAVETTTAAPATFATAVDVPVWPPLAVAVPNGSEVDLLHFNYEDYGPKGWAAGYCTSGNSGYVQATTPLDVLLEADADSMLLAGPNPRAAELNVMIGGPSGNTLWRIDSLTDPRSYRVRHAGRPAVRPERMDLHDPGDMAELAYQLAHAGARVEAYLGTREENPGGTDAAQPWLKGRNAQNPGMTAFLTNPASIGGAFV
jgi:hypothetical protein